MSNRAEIERFSKKLTGTANTLNQAKRDGIEAAAQASKTAFLTVPGAPKFLKGVGRKGAKVNVRYDIKGASNPTAVVRWIGPAHLVNNPTKPHDITPKRSRRAGRSRGPKAIVVAGQPVAAAHHPGTRGKHFFEKGRTLAARVAPEVYVRRVRIALAKRFTGG